MATAYTLCILSLILAPSCVGYKLPIVARANRAIGTKTQSGEPEAVERLGGLTKIAPTPPPPPQCITGGCIVIPLHFVQLTERDGGMVTEDNLKTFVEILNDEFVTTAGVKIVHFEFSSWNPIARVKRSGGVDCDLDSLIDIEEALIGSGEFIKHFNACDNSMMKRDDAVNVYIGDTYGYDDDEVGSFSYSDSFANDNEGHPFVFIDHERMKKGSTWNRYAVFEHEMGHAFGLSHRCTSGVGIRGGGSSSDPSNIMSSANSPPEPCNAPYMGNRHQKFDQQQALAILVHAAQYSMSLGFNS